MYLTCFLPNTELQLATLSLSSYTYTCNHSALNSGRGFQVFQETPTVVVVMIGYHLLFQIGTAVSSIQIPGQCVAADLFAGIKNLAQYISYYSSRSVECAQYPQTVIKIMIL